VIVPANTYIATWLAASGVGAQPVPVAPDPRTYNLDPARVEAALTPRTRAIIPVHLYGQPADLDPILDVARRRGLKVIEDAAQAHGARYKGRRAGSLGTPRGSASTRPRISGRSEAERRDDDGEIADRAERATTARA
jgi:dTDP-4-amino-4,6-dideoxygalactose transaminase